MKFYINKLCSLKPINAVARDKSIKMLFLDLLKPHFVMKTISNALQLSLYREGDLRNLSCFLKSCRPSIFGERKSAPNDRITEKLTVIKGKCMTIFRLKTLWTIRKLKVLPLRIWNDYISEMATLHHTKILQQFLFNFLCFFGTNLDWCKPAEVMFYLFSRKDIVH